MYINNEFEITKSASTGDITVIFHSIPSQFTANTTDYNTIEQIYSAMRRATSTKRASIYDSSDIASVLRSIYSNHGIDMSGYESVPTPTQSAPIDAKKETIRALSNLISFCKEFEFTPNYRFINTLSNLLADSDKSAKAYIINYFRLTDSPYAKEIKSKMNSAEFKEILEKLAYTAPTKNINSRFSIYYGNAGTGKTTKAQAECDGRCIVCNNSMLPSDLMEDFIFVEGKPSFKPSALWECMTEGKAITLDEINLLPFDSLRFLQGVLDGKTEFLYKGNTVKIADGFKIIGTMNLTVNGSVFSLPEPLVDRCAYIEEFNLSATNLYSAI